MAFIAVPNTALFELKFLYGAEVVENTLWYENIVPPTLTALEDQCAAILASWGTNMSPLQGAGVAMYEIKATSMQSETAPSATVAITPPLSGEIESPSLPSSVTWAIQFKTELRGRSYRGRNYWIGLTESQVTANLIDTTLAGNIVDAYEAFAVDTNNDGWQHVVVSRYSEGAPRVTGVTTPVISYNFADLYVDNQRRRLTGRGS